MFAMRYMINISYFCTVFKQLASMQDQGSLDTSSLKAFQNNCQAGCFCMVCYCS